jgi:hypothetical protein
MAVAIVESTRLVTGGVDTHLDTHVAAVLDASGGVLGVESFPATRAGYVSLASWPASGPLSGSEWRARAPMAPGLLAICAVLVSR